MPRSARVLKSGEPTIYHVISYSAPDGFPFGDAEKDYLVKLFKQFGRLYFTEIIGYCVLGDHFHLLVKMLPDTDYSDQEIKHRFHGYFGEKRILTDDRVPFFRRKYSNLSKFVRDIKIGFSRFYNRSRNRHGAVWGDRFKSIIVERGEMLINCLALIDLNPVRVGLVRLPEDYCWSSIGDHVRTKNRDNSLSLDLGLREFDNLDPDERFVRYRRFVHEKGRIVSGQINEGVAVKERRGEFIYVHGRPV